MEGRVPLYFFLRIYAYGSNGDEIIIDLNPLVFSVSGHPSFWHCCVHVYVETPRICLTLPVKMHEICSTDSQENYQNCCHQLSDFKTKMHQI